MEANEYERLVEDIATNMYKRKHGKKPLLVKSGKKNKWTGKSNYEHQIDVSVEGKNKVILIECKYWKRRVSIGAVLTFAARIIDINKLESRNILPILVSKEGLQSGAKKMAKYYNIQWKKVSSKRDAIDYIAYIWVSGKSSGKSGLTGNLTVVKKKK